MYGPGSLQVPEEIVLVTVYVHVKSRIHVEFIGMEMVLTNVVTEVVVEP